MDSRILLLTGKRAERLVRDYSSESDVETEVEVLPISIASFMNLEIVLKKLKEKNNLEKFSMVMVPGLAEFDLEEAETELGTPFFKGPKHAADISLVLNNLNSLELSKEIPASDLLEDEISSGAKKFLQEIKEKYKGKIGESDNFEIGGGENSVFAGPDFPPRIVGEIINAPKLSNEELIEIGEKYAEEGAEILDIGMTTQEEMSREIPRIINVLRENFDLPLSIDTTEKEEIRTALDVGIDLIVSIDGSTIDYFEGLDTPAVIIPRNPEEDYYPKKRSDKIDYLEDLLEKAEKLDYERPVADLILEPIGRDFVDSLMAFQEFREENSKIPLFMGIGNVIELCDADSIGMTALLLGSANEMNVDFVLSVEASDKTQRNISEISTARDMMILAKHRNSVPKDLGLDLLRFKEKRKLFDPYEKEIEKDAEVVEASLEKEFPRDSKGFFKIFTENEKIVAVFHSFEDSNVVIKGKTASEVADEIVDRNLISELSHATYLGRELEKAEIAIRTGRGYIQEEKLF
ncbi:hypothetical protein AKJ49_00435 [candidate division MSBL1 archaeon SCGC-AAA382A03]|uniref:Pterin-binding domain-containing protein n=1 Tax=candidate division MSBL1 archaeon SCGC-AAA382A03 TaxID=1698278 RepID=A0A133VGP9_9EURY|nr:hypothetical protein AKJ49_00435 [candidate division MSBL1 archaeon SCGC-AAA382A03]